MKLGPALALLMLVLIAAPLAFANGSTVTMKFTGVNGANNGTYYVSPYFGTINPGTSSSQNVVLFCDDIKNSIHFGQIWTANITNLGTAINTTNGFANTRYGGLSGSPVFTNAAVGDSPVIAYEEAAWLVSQFAANPGSYVNLQEALWDVMNPGSYSGAGVSWWLGQAAAHYSSINPYGFEIITNVGPLSLTGQQQEFIVMVPTPEPGSIAMMLCGVLTLSLLAVFRARLAA